MKKILGVITARGGSKGIPRKNIKPLGGKPLIVYTIDIAKKSKLITNLIVSTDDLEIADIARSYGADVPFIRPAELAADNVSNILVVRHAADFMEKKLGIIFDILVVLQPTSPFRTVEDLDGTISKLIKTKADSAVSIVEIPGNQHPIKAKKMEGDYLLPYCFEEPEGFQRQNLAKAYKRNGAVYALRRDLLMEEGKIWGKVIAGYIVPADRSIDIDTEYDWVLAEYMLRARL